ncbi:DUF5131 family protein [bacterium]|nr:DUF5131 family protein [bacterium]
MQKTDISYGTDSWNPVAMMCSPISDGCANCWHLAMCHRLAANPVIDMRRRAAYGGGIPLLLDDELQAPAKRKKPARILVQFMGDLWHMRITPSEIRVVLEAMEGSTQHRFLMLTKRLWRVLDLFGEEVIHLPPKHIWLGCSICNQAEADRDIPRLAELATAGWNTWVSLEPLLEPVVLPAPLPQWVVVGGESGAKARPMHPDWARAIRDQCEAAGVPFYMKQMAVRAPIPPDLQIHEIPEALRLPGEQEVSHE